MGALTDLSNKILSLLGKKNKILLSEDDFLDILKLQKQDLNNLNTILNSFKQEEMYKLSRLYYSIKFNTNDKNDVSYILPTLIKRYKGQALVFEKKEVFGASVFACNVFLKLNDELYKYSNTFISDEGITVNNSKISTVILLGILKETDFFIDYVRYLFAHFSGAISKTQLYPIPYQAKFLQNNLDEFIDLVNSSCNQDSTYSFIKDISNLKKLNADLYLYSNGQSFLDFLDPRAISGSNNRRLTKGVIGLNVVSKIAMLINDYKHSKYLKNKQYKEYLENKAALLRYDLLGVDPNSSEYKEIVKRIELYEAEITKTEKKLKEYEEEE